MPCLTPLDVDFGSNVVEILGIVIIYANMYSYFNSYKYNLGDETMESDQAEIVKMLERANENQLKEILDLFLKLSKTFT